jgi:alkylated DNA repair dioxygenase AlkB
VAIERPGGLFYEPDFLSSGEEAELLAFMEATEFRSMTIRGQTARRTVRHYGYDYGYESARVVPGEPLPDELAWLRDRAAGLAGLPPGKLAQTLVSRYPPGAPIGWHRDAAIFGPTLIGVSLGASSRLRLRSHEGEERRSFELELEPRSAYVLSGPSRSEWQHSIPPVKDLRYSITFRTLPTRDTEVSTTGR